MASVNIKPLEDKILVQANEAETTTASGLVIPDTAKEKPQEGTVVAVGPGRWDEDGEKRIAQRECRHEQRADDDDEQRHGEVAPQQGGVEAAQHAKPLGDGARKATRLLWSAVLSSPWARAISARRSHSWKKPGNLTHMALAVALAYELEEQGSSAEAVKQAAQRREQEQADGGR